MFEELRSFFRASLFDPVHEDDSETAAAVRRRRIVVGLTLVLGAVALGLALRVEPGDALF